MEDIVISAFHLRHCFEGVFDGVQSYRGNYSFVYRAVAHPKEQIIDVHAALTYLSYQISTPCERISIENYVTKLCMEWKINSELLP